MVSEQDLDITADTKVLRIRHDEILSHRGEYDVIICDGISDDIALFSGIESLLVPGGKALVRYTPGPDVPIMDYARKLLANTGMTILDSDDSVRILCEKPSRAFTGTEMMDILLREIEGFEDEGRDLYMDDLLDAIRKDL